MSVEETIKRRLEFMMNRHWLWDGLIIHVQGSKQTKEKVYLTTNIGLLEYNYDEFMEKREKSSELSEPYHATPSRAVVKHEEVKLNTLEQLNSDFDVIAILKDSINKIKENPGYIKQSEAINKVVRTALDIAKTELQINRMGKK